MKRLNKLVNIFIKNAIGISADAGTVQDLILDVFLKSKFSELDAVISAAIPADVNVSIKALIDKKYNIKFLLDFTPETAAKQFTAPLTNKLNQTLIPGMKKALLDAKPDISDTVEIFIRKL